MVEVEMLRLLTLVTGKVLILRMRFLSSKCTLSVGASSCSPKHCNTPLMQMRMSSRESFRTEHEQQDCYFSLVLACHAVPLRFSPLLSLPFSPFAPFSPFSPFSPVPRRFLSVLSRSLRFLYVLCGSSPVLSRSPPLVFNFSSWSLTSQAGR